MTKNEEKNIKKCIESFRGCARRFVIVDSYSTDRTEQICIELDKQLRKIGSQLDFYQNKWVSYADQLNWVVYILYDSQNVFPVVDEYGKSIYSIL